MPELPEVEVLVRHLRPLLRGRKIQGVEVRRVRVIRPTSTRRLRQTLTGAAFTSVSRRGKFLLFRLCRPGRREPILLVGHLGMTGRMYLLSRNQPLPKHTAVVLDLGRERFVYEDQRYFGRLSLDASGVERLGFEPLGAGFTAAQLATALGRSRRAIKVRLLDQDAVAGVGNIYASEALHRARISPRQAAGRLNTAELRALHRSIRAVLVEAVRFGSTIPLRHGPGRSDGLFYYGSAGGGAKEYTERLRVYDRAGQPCGRCGRGIQRLVQAGRSTFYCPGCQGRIARRDSQS
jgi:formamidopyrimidine-DNA glycosylase